MSVSYAAQRNSHFVTELDPHQNASQCSLPLSLHGELGLPECYRNKGGMPTALIGTQGGQFMFNIFISLFPPPTSISFVCNYIFIKWLPRRRRVLCSAKAAAHAAERSASVRWPPSKETPFQTSDFQLSQHKTAWDLTHHKLFPPPKMAF